MAIHGVQPCPATPTIRVLAHRVNLWHPSNKKEIHKIFHFVGLLSSNRSTKTHRMGNRPSSDSAAVAAQIMAKRDELLNRRENLLVQRSEITAAIRRASSELEDCRATARFFGLQIDFPDEDDIRQSIARREHELRMERARTAQVSTHRYNSADATIMPSSVRLIEGEVTTSKSETQKEKLARTPDDTPPPLREFLLSQLQAIGSSGGKAAGLRAIFEQQFGRKIHEKSVGMTLYRLLKQGEVHRDGHTWFYGPANATASGGEIAS